MIYLLWKIKTSLQHRLPSKSFLTPKEGFRYSFHCTRQQKQWSFCLTLEASTIFSFILFFSLTCWSFFISQTSDRHTPLPSPQTLGGSPMYATNKDADRFNPLYFHGTLLQFVLIGEQFPCIPSSGNVTDLESFLFQDSVRVVRRSSDLPVTPLPLSPLHGTTRRWPCPSGACSDSL